MPRNHVDSAPPPAVAVIGIGCILPGGVEGPDDFWALLTAGRDAIIEVPADRWNLAPVFDRNPAVPGRTNARWGGFVGGVDRFDAAFFGVSPREAAVMDPQQRLLMHAAWAALEHAGVPPERLAGSATGVFIGISHSDYHAIQLLARRQIDVHSATGGALSIAANRISHHFDLRGRSIAFDTACSSSLVAIDAAFQALASGECSLALAGGVNALLTPDVTISFSRAGMLSPVGRCKTFADEADGYVRGEGAGIVVLKRLDQARRDGDRALAILRATSVNQDGATSTITVPNGEAQMDMLRAVCRRAAVDPRQVGYVEAHGTGTPVGDPIEAAAIGRVFGAGRSPDAACLVGSVKTNIGHLEPAAGIAGFIKAVLAVRAGVVPPNLHFSTPSRNIPFAELGIAVPTSCIPWPAEAGRRIAVVNSFGFGGTNACALIEAAEAVDREDTPEHSSADWPLPFLLSAGEPDALRQAATRLAEAVRQAASPIVDVAGTLALRRNQFKRRLVLLARDRDSLLAGLDAAAAQPHPSGAVIGEARGRGRLAFVFTGQGAQWTGMGRRLMDRDPVFAAAMSACDRLFRDLAGWSLLDEIARPASDSRLDSTAVAQPATFAVQVALAARWRAWGVVPDGVIGHSIGEIAAAHVAGALTLEEAVRVVYHRSRLQERSRHRGAMAAIGLPVTAVAELVRTRNLDLEIAAENAPGLVTVSGEKDDLAGFVDAVGGDDGNVFRQLLRIDYAFHSRQMDPFEQELRESLADLSPALPQLAMFSTVIGRAVDSDPLDAEYWWRNMRRRVLFRQAVDEARAAGFDCFLELGPHPTLIGPIRACFAEDRAEAVVASSLQRDSADEEAMLRGLAALHVAGVPVDWSSVLPAGRRFAELPPHPMNKQVFWADSEESRAARFEAPVHPLLGFPLKSAQLAWQAEISPLALRFLEDHRIDAGLVFPAAGYVDMVLAAARETLGDLPFEVLDLSFQSVLSLAADQTVAIETSYNPARSLVRIASHVRDGEPGWTERASARIHGATGTPATAPPLRATVEPPEQVDPEHFYGALLREGHQYGPTFRGVRTIWHERGAVWGRVVAPQPILDELDTYCFHPALLDACFQVIRGFRDFSPTDRGGEPELAIPVGIDRLVLFKRPRRELYVLARLTLDDPRQVVADLTLLDDAGELVAVVQGFRCRRTPSATALFAAASLPAFYRESWVEATPRVTGGEDVAAPRPPPGTWLVAGGADELAERVVATLRARGAEAVRAACTGAARRRLSDADASPPVLPDAWHRALVEAGADCQGVVFLGGLAQPTRLAPAAALERAQQHGAKALIALAQAMALREGASARLWVVTAGAVAVRGAGCATLAEIAAAPMIGVVRTLANELPQLRSGLIDLDPAAPDWDKLVDELLDPGDETEVALRDGRRFAGRTAAATLADLAPPTAAWDPAARAPTCRVTMTAPGDFSRLRLQEAPPCAPGAGEVTIDVHAVALNFRDVIAASGLLPADAEDEPAWQALGLECAGIVRAADSDAGAFAPGARVIALARGALASQLRVPSMHCIAIPDGLDFAAAAALPIAYMTAHHGLVELARLRRGETVLIHAATGGVGLAAVAIAQRIGARIIATAGSPAKRDHLRALGIEHVLDSRSLAFAEAVRAITGGRGVDVVLNSLPGPFIAKGLESLAPFGRFVELGKRDVYADSAIGLRALRDNVAFFVVDLARMVRDRPDAVADMMKALLAELAAGRLPSLPVETFPIGRVADAFRHMAQARHVGKVVVTFDDAEARIELDPDHPLRLRPDAAYLVTGGLGGFGLVTAQWLAARGARHLVLLGRTGARSAAARAAIARLRADGVRVQALSVDVTSRRALARALAAVERTGAPLAGIVHAAGLIEDRLVQQIDDASFDRVFAGKAVGALNLHELTRGRRLDFFVMFGSIAVTLGSPGQTSYVATNRFLEALAAHRRRQGLPALAVAWGAIGGTGYFVRQAEVAEHVERLGILRIPADEALAALGDLMRRAEPVVGHALIRWQALRASTLAPVAPRFSFIAAASGTKAARGSLRNELRGAAPEMRVRMIGAFVRKEVAAVLKTDVASVDPRMPLGDLGLDSLTAFELKSRIELELSVAIPLTRVQQKLSVDDLARDLSERTAHSAASDLDAGAESGDAVGTLVLSPLQEALWLRDGLESDSAPLSRVIALDATPGLEPQALRRSFQELIEHHAILRSFVYDLGLGPVRGLLDASAFSIEEHDVRERGDSGNRTIAERLACVPLPLAEGPLFRAGLVRGPACDTLVVCAHPLVADARAFDLILAEWIGRYRAIVGGNAAEVAAGDFTAAAGWQRQFATSGEARHQIAYWRTQLAGTLRPPAALRGRPCAPESGATTRSSPCWELPADLVEKLAGHAQTEGVAPADLIFGAWAAALSDPGGDDCVVVLVETGRHGRQFADVVGPLENPLPVRLGLRAGGSVLEHALEAARAARSARQHQDVPATLLVRMLGLLRDADGMPPFRAGLAWHRDLRGGRLALLPGSVERHDFGTLRRRAIDAGRDPLDLQLTIVEDQGLAAAITWRSDLFTAQEIELLADGFRGALDALCGDAPPRLQLPRRDSAGSPGQTSPPLGGTPESATIIAGIMRDLLALDAAGADQDFFAIGADSLTAARLAARLTEVFGTPCRVADVLRCRTAAALAGCIAERRSSAASATPRELAPPAPRWQPLPVLRAEGVLPPIDCAALLYLPDLVLQAGRADRRTLGAVMLDEQPLWHAIARLPIGSIAIIFLPVLAGQLFTDRPRVRQAIDRGLDLGRRIGARCIALAGLLPAVTDYGRDLVPAWPDGLPTTGHGTTATAIVMTIDEILRRCGRDLPGEEVAFLGMGSVGRATLALMLDRLPHPRALTLLDVPSKEHELIALAAAIAAETGFSGPIRIATAAGTAPDPAYDASLIVGATNAPDVLDVARLRPGAIVVDDSVPNCFALEAAAARLAERGDVLCIAGGLVKAPVPIQWTLSLPAQAARWFGQPAITAMIGSRRDEITGCVLSALLSAARGLPATVGPATLASSRVHFDCLRELGFAAARPHCGWLAPTEGEIGSFRRRFGRPGA